ncbi:hypothetical protein PR048_023941 [Dryococelus australis]|uniref:Uncharacterized protein n=1 Tax=Dryococelus australis TaxID=614101 RepID=A0ABQ9GVJ2_9NEOP|nr:hypothetical protein PR048_023941 [Dryococelus australis]
MEQCRNARAGETGDPHCIARHESHLQKSGTDPAVELNPSNRSATPTPIFRLLHKYRLLTYPAPIRPRGRHIAVELPHRLHARCGNNCPQRALLQCNSLLEYENPTALRARYGNWNTRCSASTLRVQTRAVIGIRHENPIWRGRFSLSVWLRTRHANTTAETNLGITVNRLYPGECRTRPVAAIDEQEVTSAGEWREQLSTNAKAYKSVQFTVKSLYIDSFIYFCKEGRGNPEARLLSSHIREPRSIPGGIASGFSHVGIVPDDVAGWRVFSGISSFPRPLIPTSIHTHLTPPSSALKTTNSRAAQISPLTPLIYLRTLDVSYGIWNKFIYLNMSRSLVRLNHKQLVAIVSESPVVRPSSSPMFLVALDFLNYRIQPDGFYQKESRLSSQCDIYRVPPGYPCVSSQVVRFSIRKGVVGDCEARYVICQIIPGRPVTGQRADKQVAGRGSAERERERGRGECVEEPLLGQVRTTCWLQGERPTPAPRGHNTAITTNCRRTLNMRQTMYN